MKQEKLISQPWFQELKEEVQQELIRRSQQPDGSASGLAEEAKRLQKQQQGWTMSLANPELPTATRRLVEVQIHTATDRINEIELLQTETQAQMKRQNAVVDPHAVVERLQRLDEVLAAHNPSLANIELSLHIDRIDCFSEGRVVLRTCRLGVMADAIDVFFNKEPCVQSTDSVNTTTQTQPRRRARRRMTCGEEPSEELKFLAAWSTDPHRFAGLDEHWFEEHEFQVPEPTGWYKEHAMEVAEKRAEGLSQEELAEQFGRTIQTIRRALRHAVCLDPSLEYLLAKKPRRRWHEDHVADVVDLVSQGWDVPEIAKHFGKSEPTIRKAINHAEKTGHLRKDSE